MSPATSGGTPTVVTGACTRAMGVMGKPISKMRGWLASGALLCAAAPWGNPVPSGVMAEYLVHCDPWSPADDAEACAELVGRLAAQDNPSRDERLALLLLRRNSLVDAGVAPDEGCAGLEAISADHPDYAEALYYLALYDCAGGRRESAAVLRHAAAIEPDNYRVLDGLLMLVDGLPPEADGRGMVPGIEPGTLGIDPDTLAEYREAYYEAGKAYTAWRQAAFGDDDLPGWRELFTPARSIRAAALRNGDIRAAQALQARLRRDLGLDALDYSATGARASLALACHPALYGSLGLEDVCVSGVENVARRASAGGLPLPGYLLEAVEGVTDGLRRAACAASKGESPFVERLALGPGECEGPEATETAAVARLRAVLEQHGGAWSSEHYRVHAQGFLGDGARREGLRAALRADPENAQARCDLTRALLPEDPDAATNLLGEGDPSCLEGGPFVWGDRRGR